jgi:hypothetical protein
LSHEKNLPTRRRSLNSALCQARIGETLDECTARYGPMLKIENATGKFFSDYPQHCFSFEGVLIRVRFLQGHSAQEEFYSSYSLSSEKRAEIVKNNSKRITGTDVVVENEYFGDGGKVTITSKEFDKLIRAEHGPGF